MIAVLINFFESSLLQPESEVSTTAEDCSSEVSFLKICDMNFLFFLFIVF